MFSFAGSFMDEDEGEGGLVLFLFAFPGLDDLSMVYSRRESCTNQEKQFY